MKENIEDEESPFNRLDAIFNEIGNFGKFQFVNLMFLVIPIFLCGCYSTNYIFTARKINYRCAIDACDSDIKDYNASWLENAIPKTNDGSFRACSRYSYKNQTNPIGNETYCPADFFDQERTEFCNHWIYDEYTTIVSEFDLGCEEWKRTLIGTLNSAGQFISMPLTGILSDRFGRKTLFILTNLSYGIAGIMKGLAPNYWFFAFSEFLEASLTAGSFSIGLVLAMELVDPSRRTLGSVIISAFYGVGTAFLGYVAWKLTYWRTMVLVLYIPVLFVIFYKWLIPESMRWLLMRGKTQEAIKILRKAAKMNNKPVPENSLQELHLTFIKMHKDISGNKSDEKKESSNWDILKSKTLMIRFVACCSWWITSTFVYYGMLLNSVDMAGNLYLNYVLVAIIELPSHIVYYFTVDVLGRKISLCWSFMATGLACFAFTFITEGMYWTRLVTYLFGKFGINIAFTVLYVYTAEIFPTPQRNSLLGLCSMFGRFGSVAAPQMPLLSVYNKQLPLYLFGITSIISGLTVLGFPETNKLKLPDTIEEAENLAKQKPQKKLNIQEY